MRRRGVTLIEGLLAAAILATTAVALLEALRGGVKQTERVEGEVLAAARVQEAIDLIAAVPYTELARIATARPAPGALAPAAFAARLEAPALAALRKRIERLAPTGSELLITLEPVTASGAGRLLLLTVEARWVVTLSPGRPVTRTAVLRRLLTDDGEVDA